MNSWGSWAWLLIPAVFGCGTTTRNGSAEGAGGAVGTAGTSQTGDGARAGAGAHAGNGGAGATGNGPASGGSTQVDAPPECPPFTWEPKCIDGCSVVYSHAFQCDGALTDLELADTALLVSRKPSSAFPSTTIFGFNIQGGLTVERELPPDPNRLLLTHDDGGPLLLQAGDAGVKLEQALTFPGAALPLDARFESGELYVLTTASAKPKSWQLWRKSADAPAEKLLEYPDLDSMSFIAGMGATALLVNDANVSADEEPLWAPDAAIKLYKAPRPGVSGYARQGAIAFLETKPGRLELSDANGSLSTLGADWPQCTGGFVANYPDVCETRATDQPSQALEGQVLSAGVINAHERAWLAVVTIDPSFQCRIATMGGCFETLPCNCGYVPSYSGAQATLTISSLDASLTSLRVDLGQLADAKGPSLPALWLRISEGGDAGTFTVAIAPDDSYQSTVKYLLLAAK